MEQLIKRSPFVLSANLDRTIKPKIKLFLDLGLSPTDIAEIISADPWILSISTDNRIGPSFLALKRVLGSLPGVSKVLKLSGRLLQYDLDKTMIPNIEFLKSCGISSSQIVKFVYSYPGFFVYKPESIRDFVKRVDEMGFNRESKMYLHAIRAISSMTVENWERKLELFRSLGFSDNDVAKVFKRAPHVFAISQRKIKEVTQMLLRPGKSDISVIINCPELLSCSVENRLKPRLGVLEVLERKNLLQKNPRLTTVCKISDEAFFERFVLPYSNEVGNVYASLMRAKRQQKYELLAENSQISK
ncbi:transcription termination factor MTERF5, chloroplastic-like [Actinidia eriantha]|uniref:transcription termination factor MTERF5, chloroplastic-like n=1 Tax=Actinidia eriantha TaxID=165200 RepID=UPI00258EF4C6|nr:transcription termination factor MTERF5, chloroplastic-like [Actinidia eriantha]